MTTAFDETIKRMSVDEAIREGRLNLCPSCRQPLVSCLACKRPRGAWPDPTSGANYCSDRCKARSKKRRHRARA